MNSAPLSGRRAASGAFERASEFSDIYSRHFRPLCVYLQRYTRNAEEAADLAQDTFIRLIVSGSEPENAHAWLRRTGYRLFVDRCRRRVPAAANVPIEEMPGFAKAGHHSGADTPESEFLRKERQADLELLVNTLDTRARRILHYRLHEEKSYRQIAFLLQCPENTVRTIARRARLRLARLTF